MRTKATAAALLSASGIAAAAAYVTVESPAAANTPSKGSVTASGVGRDGGNNGKGAGNGSGTGVPGKALTTTFLSHTTAAPGAPGSLTIAVSNPNPSDVLITSIVTTVSRTSSATCDPQWFQVQDPTPSAGTLVPAGATVRPELPVIFKNLSGTVQDGCKSATYDFSYTVSAKQVTR